MDKVLQTISRPFLQSLRGVRGHHSSKFTHEFLDALIRGAPSDDHRPRHSFFIGIGGLRRRRVALFSFWLDLLLLRLVLRGRGGPVGLGLRARLFSASSSPRHFCFAVLCSLQAVVLLTRWRKGVLHQSWQQCSVRESQNCCYKCTAAAYEGKLPGSPAAKKPQIAGVIYLQKMSACPQRQLVPGGTRSGT